MFQYSPVKAGSVPFLRATRYCSGVRSCFHSSSGFNYRDTDWYELPAGANVDGFSFCVTGEYETLSGYINADLGCGAPVFEEFSVESRRLS